MGGLGGVTCAAADSKHRVGQSLILVAALLASAPVAGWSPAHSPVTCPGLDAGSTPGTWECTADCQQATCSALAAFFRSTYNASNTAIKSWRNRQGWEDLLTKTCEEITSRTTADGKWPSYCDWYGITCCTGIAPPPAWPSFTPLPACTLLKTIEGINVQVNGLNGSVSDDAFQQSIAQLHACGLVRLELSGNALTGSLTNIWGDMVNLTTLNLAKNRIEGTIPDALRKLNKLTYLYLDRNPMHGTLPEWLSELTSLTWLGLAALTGRNADGRLGLMGTIPRALPQMTQMTLIGLGTNSLTGTLPPNFCHGQLMTLDLRGNQIQGNMSELLPCTTLWFLDISGNMFTGVLPDVPSWGWSWISMMDISNNAIEGTVPAAFYKLSNLMSINAAGNKLSGTVNSALGRMTFLTTINFRSNLLTGPLDESIWYLPRLGLVDFSSNRLTGTLSPAVGMSYATVNILLNDNMLTGRIPPELGVVSQLLTVKLTGNKFSCSGTNPDSADAHVCQQEELLPCFLYLTHITVPLADASNMECPVAVWKNRDAAVQNCSGFKPTQLGDQARSLANVDMLTQRWEIDPAYYQYHRCKCLGGYHGVWTRNHTVLVCMPNTNRPLPSWFVPTALVSSLLIFLIVAAIGLLVWLRMTVTLRKKWQREKELSKNRLKGVPNGGPASIVVTDVESYSELMQQNAAVTTRALGIHNSILRKAVTAHAGHVIEQEGDSWSVAFYRPVDAVAFCLQVQQALQRSQWPNELGGHSVSKHERYSSAASTVTDTDYGTGEVYVKQQVARSHSVDSSLLGTFVGGVGPLPKSQSIDATTNGVMTAATDTPESPRAASVTPSLIAGLLRGLASKGGARISAAGVSLARRTQSIGSIHAEDLPGKTRKMTQSTVGTVSPRTASLRQEKSRRVSVESAASFDKGSGASQAGKAGRTGSITWAIQGKKSAPRADAGTVRGLRVRMGVASGWIPANSDIIRSALFELTKVVSDMAHGGQVLLEHHTAVAVREWLTDLGSVDHKGYNDKLLLQAHQAEARTVLGVLTACFRTALNIGTHDRDALLLDMGQFWVPSIASTLQAATAAAPSAADAKARGLHHTVSVLRGHSGAGLQRASSGGNRGDAALKQLLHMHGSNAAVTASAAAVVDGAMAQQCPVLHLHSILARPLHTRSKIWKGELNLSQGMHQIAKGYFEAPGAVVADLSPAAAFLDVERPLLPPVTVVFAAIEGGKVLVRKKEHVAAIVHNVLSRTMQALLLSLPDGYLCREQEAVLKYMVAFREPARAAEWCLMMQEVLQHMPWPIEVIEGFSALAASPSTSITGGRITGSSTGLGVRPKLKMGLAEGVPHDIALDHLGRADYFGTSVNLAARIMSAAAHSGQVVMCSEMAQTVFSTWRYEAEIGMQTAAAAGATALHQEPPTAGHSHAWLSLSGSEGGRAKPPGMTDVSSAGHTAESSAHQAAAPAVDADSSPGKHRQGGNGDPIEQSPLQSHSMPQPGPIAPESKQAGSTAAIQIEPWTNAVSSQASAPILQPVNMQLLSTEGATASKPRMPAALGITDTLQVTSANGGQDDHRRLVHVTAHHIGTYAFKGCGAMDMVCLTSDTLMPEAVPKATAPPRGAKGTLIMASDGPVIGLQDCPVMLPNIMPEFRHAWEAIQPAHPPASPRFRHFDSRLHH